MSVQTAVSFKKQLICVRLPVVEKRVEDNRARKSFLLTNTPWVCVCVCVTWEKIVRNVNRGMEVLDFSRKICSALCKLFCNNRVQVWKGRKRKGGESERQWLMTTEGQSRGGFGGWEITQGREHGEFNTGCLCWLQSARLGRHLQHGLWLHQVSGREWWRVCSD